jgi:hypothetical protein
VLLLLKAVLGDDPALAPAGDFVPGPQSSCTLPFISVGYVYGLTHLSRSRLRLRRS